MSETTGDTARALADAQARELARLREEVAALRRIAVDLHWLARRYADGRLSYAVGLHNDHTRALLALGVALNETGDGTVWARDGYRWHPGNGGRGFADGLTAEEAARGREPNNRRWLDEEVVELRREMAGMRAIVKAGETLIELAFEGEPVPKGRPRLGRNGNVRTPAATKAAEEAIGWRVREKYGALAPTDRRVGLALAFASARPAKQRAGRADLDNLIKLVKDALNGIAYADDSQVEELHATLRREAEGASTAFRVYLLD